MIQIDSHVEVEPAWLACLRDDKFHLGSIHPIRPHSTGNIESLLYFLDQNTGCLLLGRLNRYISTLQIDD